MMKEELSRDGEYTRAFHPLRLGGSASMLAYVHPEWTGDLVEIGTIEEGMRESVNESECDLVARRFQGLVQQGTLPMRHRAVGQSVHDQERRRVLGHVSDRTGGPDTIRYS